MTQTRRRFLASIGAVALGSGLSSVAGCGSSQGGAGDAAELRFTFWNQAWAENMKAAITAFQDIHPKISVTMEYSAFDGYFDKLNTQLGGGKGPDVITLAAQLAEYAKREVLADLTPYVGKEINMSDWDADSKDAGKIGDKLVGLPTTFNVPAVIYDKTALSRLGLSLPGPDWTMDDFAALTARASKAGGDNFWGTTDQAGVAAAFETMVVRPRGRELFTADGKIVFEEQDLVDWFEYWAKLRDVGAAPPAEVTAATKPGQANNLMIQRKTAISPGTYSDVLTTFAALTEHELHLTEYPRDAPGSRPGQYLRPGLFWTVGARSDHQAEGALFANALVGVPEVGKELATALSSPSAGVRAAAQGGNLSKAETESLAFVERAKTRSTPMNIRPPAGYAGWVSEFSRAAEDLSFNKINMAEAVDRVMGYQLG